MARRGAVRNFETALGAIGVLALIITAILVTGWNPLPNVSGNFSDWWEKVASSSGKLSEPETLWTDRVGGQPSAAVIAGDAVIVQMRGTIEARGLRSGTELWTKEADWAAMAGDGATQVVVVGRRGKGLEAIDPAAGTVKWKAGDAVGAWTYQDTVLALSCDGLTDCSLTARSPKDGAQIWKLALPGIGRVLAGVNSDLLGTRLLSDTFDDAVRASPGVVPAMLGFPVDQRVQVVDTITGKRLRTEEPTTNSRVVVVGGRVLVSTAAPKDGNCRFSLEARDPATGKVVWRKDGYDLHTSSGAGCEQRRDPAGADTVIAAIRGDNREVFLSPRDGRELFVGGPGDTLVAADSQYGLIRGADKKTLQVINLTTGKTAWKQEIAEKADVAITRYAVLVNDPGTGTLKAYKPDSGSLRLDAKTTSDVLGVGPDGLMISRGRTLGFLPYT